MPLDLVQQPPRLGRWEGLVQAGAVMRVEVVLHQLALLGLGEVDVHQLLHAPGVVPSRPPLAHPHVPPTPQRLTHQQLGADALALVLVVHLKATAPPARRSPFPEQLLAGFVEADHRIPRVVGQQVGLDHVFHAPDELGIGVRRDTPGRDDPGLAGVFFSACRTASTLTRSTRPSTTRSSAKSCKVQWQRPSGGSLQASWINFRSTSPVILISPGRAGWGRWSRAAGSPSVTNRRRTRSTVRRLIPRERTMAVAGRSSPGDGSAGRTTRAWISLRAAPLPTLTSCSKAARSSASKGPRYLSMAAPVLEVRH